MQAKYVQTKSSLIKLILEEQTDLGLFICFLQEIINGLL